MQNRVYPLFANKSFAIFAMISVPADSLVLSADLLIVCTNVIKDICATYLLFLTQYLLCQVLFMRGVPQLEREFSINKCFIDFVYLFSFRPTQSLLSP